MGHFERETLVGVTDPHCATAIVHPQWCIGSVPNGGYLAALMKSAAKTVLPDLAEPLSSTMHFLRPAIACEEAVLDVRRIRLGRGVSTVMVTLLQQHKPRATMLAAFGQLPETPTSIVPDPARPALPNPQDCLLRSGAEQGVELPILSRLEIRLHPDDAVAGSSGKARMRGWIRLRDHTIPQCIALTMMADAFPPSILGLSARVGWVPTIEMTTHVRARPASVWLSGCFRTIDLRDGSLIEDGTLWDESGNIVACTRQLAIPRYQDEA